MSKFYEFVQNNNGGSFDVNEKVAHSVFVEADSASEADESAAAKAGIYFNGVEEGDDCECCGDRWSRASEQRTALLENLTPAKRWKSCWSNETRIYFKDGRIVGFKNEKEGW